MKEYDNAEQLPGMIYSWCALPVPNSEDWEKGMCVLLKKTEELTVLIGDETKDMIVARLEKAVTDVFKSIAKPARILYNTSVEIAAWFLLNIPLYISAK